MSPTAAILIIGAYLLGSIPFGLLIGIAHGTDLRKIGSGNIGATNVARALGREWAYACFALDVLKGMLPMLAAMRLLSPGDAELRSDRIVLLWLWLAVGCAAVLGHVFPIYLKFKGGKGVSTSFGVALGLWPYFTLPAAAALLVWVATVLLWRYVSLASMIASVAFPLVLLAAIVFVPPWSLAELWPLLLVATAIPIMVIFRHRENIKRLAARTESRISRKSTPKT
ncbi:MAG: glycerol-3-phosphate 1-O-acyltransferase PlsY [Phycisphaerales bacterium]|nr:MAG: glycerol-3-phosphate 1-O-acyltransferase PlsY [Phycisphaerales bacterium]